MPVFRPIKITAFDSTGLHVLNQVVKEIEGSFQDLQKQIPPHNHLKSTSILVFGSVPANSSQEATVLLPGASTTGVAHASPAQGLKLPSGLSWSSMVTAQNQITVRVTNATTSPVTVNTQKWNVWCLQ